MEASEAVDHAGSAPGATGAKESGGTGGGDSPATENVGAGTLGTSISNTAVMTEAPGSGGKSAGTPDLPSSEPRSQTVDIEDDDRGGREEDRPTPVGDERPASRSPEAFVTTDASTAATTTTATTPAGPGGDPARSLADVLGKRSTPVSDPKSVSAHKPPAKKPARAKASGSGPGIASFFGGKGHSSGSDEEAQEPPKMPTRAERLAADEAEEAAALAAALAASEADEEDRRAKAEAANEEANGEAIAQAESPPPAPEPAPPAAPTVPPSEAKKVHPLMLAAQRKREKAAAEARAKAEAEAEAEARAVAEAKAAAEAAAKAEAEAIAKAEAEARAKAEAIAKAEAEAEAAARAKAEEEERRRVEEQAAEDAALGVDSGACEICGVDDDDGLLCDGCDGMYHAKCVDLTSVPDGEWFCASCVEHGTTSAGAGVARRKSLKRKAARDERRKAAGSFFMTPHERREAAETEAKQSLKRDLEAVKQTDAALSSGKKTHHFFAMQKEKAALAKETGATAASLNPLGLYVLPAPIEQAMPPVHVSPSIDAAVVADEAVGRNALANVVGPPRALVGLTSAITSMTPAIKSTPMGSIASMETEETEPDDSTPMDLEEAEDAYLTDAARFVLASKGRWNARAVASGELAAARGTLRTRLAALKTRAVARCGANTTLEVQTSNTTLGPAAASGSMWTDAYRPNATEQLVCDGGAKNGVRDWLGAWSAQIFATDAGVSKPTRDLPKKGGKRRRKAKGSDDESSDEEWDEDDDEMARATYAPLVSKKGIPANGLLLCGPVGSGKTAAVYAAAEEFGFKVLEVNPSRKRSGLEVLNQFGEATQSRRIGGGDEQKKPAASSGGIGGFFGKKQQRAAPKDTQTKDAAKNTLILFEEVDVLPGEDRGVMAALAQLVAGAKRPIVLTSNAHSLPSLVDAPLPTGTSGDGLQLARVRFRSPSPADTAVYASLVAAAEGRRVSPGEIAAACESKQGDVRRALLSAQFAASNPRASILIPRKRVSVMALEEPGLAGAASRLIARVDPRVSAAEATAPANAVKALRALSRAASLEDRRAERTAEEAAVRRRAEVVADAAAAKAERAMRNEIRIEKGVLGKARRGSLGLVAAEVVPEADSAQEGDQSEEDAEAKVAAAANAARDAFLAEAAAAAAERAASLDAADEEDAPGDSPADDDLTGPAAERPRDDWRRAMLELDSLASLAASLSAADAMLRSARATVTGPRKSWADDPKAYQGGSLGDDPDADGAFDPSDKAEERGGSDLAGEPRHTIGGGGDVAKETAAVIDAIAEHACLAGVSCGGDGGELASNGSAQGPPASALKPAAVSAHGQVPTMAAAAVRLRELAECTGVTCGRGYGRGLGVVGEGNERAFFLARMAKIQEEKERGVGEAGQGRVRRRKKASQYLQVGADVARELAVLGTFGV